MQKFRKCFILLILSYKVSKKTDLIGCNANHVSTGHKVYFKPTHPSRAKLAAINNKNGFGTAEV